MTSCMQPKSPGHLSTHYKHVLKLIYQISVSQRLEENTFLKKFKAFKTLFPRVDCEKTKKIQKPHTSPALPHAASRAPVHSQEPNGLIGKQFTSWGREASPHLFYHKHWGWSSEKPFLYCLIGDLNIFNVKKRPLCSKGAKFYGLIEKSSRVKGKWYT